MAATIGWGLVKKSRSVDVESSTSKGPEFTRNGEANGASRTSTSSSWRIMWWFILCDLHFYKMKKGRDKRTIFVTVGNSHNFWNDTHAKRSSFPLIRTSIALLRKTFVRLRLFGCSWNPNRSHPISMATYFHTCCVEYHTRPTLSPSHPSHSEYKHLWYLGKKPIFGTLFRTVQNCRLPNPVG